MERNKCVVLLTMVAIFLIVHMTAALKAETAATSKENDSSRLSTYIVHVKKPDVSTFHGQLNLESHYRSFLHVTTSSLDQDNRMVFMYKHVATGFAARLTKEEVEAMKEMEGFVSARPENIYSLQTTHSPNYLGLNQGSGVWAKSNYGKGVIIGVLDGGITPGHPSFNDEGMPPPPAKWKGKCELNGTVCNKKLIGAKNFVTDSEPPLDQDGHGTHTASTAAGNFVKGASVFGQAKGTASGLAPSAYLAIYKVCSSGGCSEASILAAIEAAIEDGVDVLSLSLGGPSIPFHSDGVAVGAFSAIKQGIFVSCSAGNEGPASSSLSNEAPWILTVGASSQDRRIKATAKLGNGDLLDGESLFQPQGFSSKLLPLVYAGAKGGSASCGPASLTSINVKGKVVLCESGGGIGRVTKGQEVKKSGGAGMILMNDEESGYSTFADPDVLPATHVSYAAGKKIIAYIKSTVTPTATILFKGTIIDNQTAPEVISFSSRGPSLESSGILKPDITGPGVSILAAWPVSVENITNTNSTFNMISGTSMSCPHLSGIAALLKSSHPDWSPAAIKSAIMTTADLVIRGKPFVDETALPANLFATGSGQVNPLKANDPGLVYDNKPEDYIPYLCGLGYTSDQVATIVQQTVNCSSKIAQAELNYPSFSITLGSKPQTYTRTVTNVGPANSSYKHQIIAPKGVNVSVDVNAINFRAQNQKASYKVTFTKNGKANEDAFSQGFLRWVSAQHTVTSPIAVTFEK